MPGLPFESTAVEVPHTRSPTGHELVVLARSHDTREALAVVDRGTHAVRWAIEVPPGRSHDREEVRVDAGLVVRWTATEDADPRPSFLEARSLADGSLLWSRTVDAVIPSVRAWSIGDGGIVLRFEPREGESGWLVVDLRTGATIGLLSDEAAGSHTARGCRPGPWAPLAVAGALGFTCYEAEPREGGMVWDRASYVVAVRLDGTVALRTPSADRQLRDVGGGLAFVSNEGRIEAWSVP